MQNEYTRRHTRFRLRLCAWVYVCALHNAGVKVSWLIFYLSGLITSPSQLLCLSPPRMQHLSWTLQGQKMLHVYNLYRVAINATAVDIPSAQNVLQHSASEQGTTKTDFMCNQPQSWCTALIKALFIWKEKHGMKRLNGINQLISWC